jgi:high-affinity iron transporter
MQNVTAENLSLGIDFGLSFAALFGVTLGAIIGVIIGTGISVSIAILLYFILLALEKKTTLKVSGYLLLFFGVGQLMQALQLLEQVDVISSHTQLWSTSDFIAESSELGYFFTILFGYEATPSAMQLLRYLTAIIVPILLAKVIADKVVIGKPCDKAYLTTGKN